MFHQFLICLEVTCVCTCIVILVASKELPDKTHQGVSFNPDGQVDIFVNQQNTPLYAFRLCKKFHRCKVIKCVVHERYNPAICTAARSMRERVDPSILRHWLSTRGCYSKQPCLAKIQGSCGSWIEQLARREQQVVRFQFVLYLFGSFQNNASF